jgi:hypothetical protein
VRANIKGKWEECIQESFSTIQREGAKHLKTMLANGWNAAKTLFFQAIYKHRALEGKPCVNMHIKRLGIL